MLTIGFLLVCLATVFPGYSASCVRQIYQFPATPYIGIENVAVRSNGHLLLNSVSTPSTYILDPSACQPAAKLLHTFPNATSMTGIAETSPDVFAVVTGTWNLTTFRGVPGSFAIWTIALGSCKPIVKHITAIPEAHGLNGMTAIAESTNLLLVADSMQGVIYKVDVTTGSYTIASQDPLIAPIGSFPLGVNGVHTRGQTLYFTNSAQGLFGKIPLNTQGFQAAAGSIIAHDVPGNAYDDFALDRDGNAFIANHFNSVSKVASGGLQTTLANSTQMVQPASCVLGRGADDKCTLYVVTDGFPNFEPSVSGQIFAVNVC